MDVFSSTRERRLWLGALVVLVLIYGTLGLAGELAERLGPQGQAWVSGAFLAVFAGAAVAGTWLRLRPSAREVGFTLGVIVVALMVLIRTLSAADRTHLFEYGVLALLIHGALTERRRRGRRVRAPALLAVASTAVLGAIDEGIQAMLPTRVGELRDIGFNAFAAALAVGLSAALARARGADPRAPQALECGRPTEESGGPSSG